MTSRLSSLLVRDGLIGVSRMEYVFQRQVIDGGALDTILLELGLVEDGRLQQYLGLATDLPVASGSAEKASEELAKACNQETANKYEVVPIGISDAGLEVVVCEPVNVEKLESLADEIDMPVQPKVVPEYRYRLNYAEVFEQEPDERFAKLAEKSQATAAINTPLPPPPQVEHTVPKVTFIEKAPDNSVEKVAEAATPDSAIPQRIEPNATQPADTTERVRGKRAPEEKPLRKGTMEMPVVQLDSKDSEPNAKSDESGTSNAEVNQSGVESEALAADPKAVEAAAPVFDSEAIDSITAEEARVFLGQSNDRDEIFAILLRAIAGRARYTALFTLKGKVAKGRVALTQNGFDNEEIRNVSIALDTPSRFQQVLDTKAFSCGPLNSEDKGVQEALATIGGGNVPKSMLLIPVVISGRVIAIAIGHNAGRGIAVRKVTELLPLGRATADAVSRLLAQMRAAKEGKAAPTASAVPNAAPKAPLDDGATVKNETSADSNSMPAPDAEMLTLFEAIESDDSDKSAAAIADALKNSEKAIAHLDFCFPGVLRKTRHDQDSQLAPAEYGPVLDLVVQLGPSCGSALREKMRDADREVRYYATLCASVIEAPDVVNEFVERLFDGDEEIRTMAVNALGKYPKEAVHSALDFARRALHSEDNARLKLASLGLAALGDISAIPDLIDAHSRGGEAAEHTQHALFLLTNQDHGGSNRQWRGWWEKNEGGKRVEWMLDGLSSKNVGERKNAAEVLRKVTGEFFGYGHDSPKKQREKARKKWQAWWKTQG